MDRRDEIPTATRPAQPRVRYALDHICAGAHTLVAWKYKATDEFKAWLASLSERERAAVLADLVVLTSYGPALGRPRVDTVAGSRYPNMKELRTRALRTFFVFDPCRNAVLLIGGDKRGEKRFYDRMVAFADRLYDVYLDDLRRKNRT
jgi:hypothetical protein